MKTVLWAIQSICPPQDAQQLMRACTALGIETCVIKSSAVGELPNVATNRPVLLRLLSLHPQDRRPRTLASGGLVRLSHIPELTGIAVCDLRGG
jgi:hypothetical protein